MNGIPIKDLLVFGKNGIDSGKDPCNTGYQVSVGDSASPFVNPPCDTGLLDIKYGKEVACDLPGRYVTIEKPGGAGTSVCLRGVAVFMDCDSPLLPWDAIDFPESISFGDSLTFVMPLATTLEEALEENVCGQLGAEFTNLPEFCSFEDITLTCTPEPEHEGLHSFDVKQMALEHPNSAKTTSITFKVIVEIEKFEGVLVKRLPFFAAPVPSVVQITKTIEATTWNFVLPEAVDLDEEDTVSLSVELGVAMTFLKFDGSNSTLEIADLSSDTVFEGQFPIKITLDNG